MRYLSVFILFLLFLGFQQPLQAKPQFEALLSSRKVTVDETITLTLQTEWPDTEGQYSFALPDLKLSQLSIDHQGESQENFVRGDQKWTRKTFSIILRALRKGEGRIESFEVPYIDPDTQKGGRFTVSEQIIKITSASSKTSLAFAVLGFSLILFLGSGIFFIRSRSRTHTASSGSPQENETVSQFKRVRENKKQQSELLHDLSVLLHQFIISFYHLAPGRITDQELLEELKRLEISRNEINSIKQLLDRFHEAKFTGMTLDDRELDNLYRDSLRFMEGKQVVGNP